MAGTRTLSDGREVPQWAGDFFAAHVGPWDRSTYCEFFLLFLEQHPKAWSRFGMVVFSESAWLKAMTQSDRDMQISTLTKAVDAACRWEEIGAALDLG